MDPLSSARPSQTAPGRNLPANQAAGENLPAEKLVSGDSEVAQLKQQVAELRQLVTKQQGGQVRFADFSPTEQAALKEKLETLSDKGRLFRQVEPNGPLLKAEPLDVFNALERHAGLAWVVDGAGHMEETSKSSRTHHEDYSYDSQQGSSSRQHSTNYASSPILGWQDMSMITTRAEGLPGVSRLPKPEGTALTAFIESSQSSYWQATGWIMDVPTGDVSVTGYVQGADSHEKRWNM